ncbi:hypothetical protein ACVWZX_003060 [Deinococcus sp. UYEF24]
MEHVICRLKILRILKETYRHRRRRFHLRVNLIAALYNRISIQAGLSQEVYCLFRMARQKLKSGRVRNSPVFWQTSKMTSRCSCTLSNGLPRSAYWGDACSSLSPRLYPTEVAARKAGLKLADFSGERLITTLYALLPAGEKKPTYLLSSSYRLTVAEQR